VVTTEFSNYDAANEAVKANRPQWVWRFSRFQAASRNEDPVNMPVTVTVENSASCRTLSLGVLFCYSSIH